MTSQLSCLALRLHKLTKSALGALSHFDCIADQLLVLCLVCIDFHCYCLVADGLDFIHLYGFFQSATRI
jgi:hypothetical protein